MTIVSLRPILTILSTKKNKSLEKTYCILLQGSMRVIIITTCLGWWWVGSTESKIKTKLIPA